MGGTAGVVCVRAWQAGLSSDDRSKPITLGISPQGAVSVGMALGERTEARKFRDNLKGARWWQGLCRYGFE